MGKIISILAIVILLVALPVALYLMSQKTQFFSKAGSDDVPRDVKITNVSDNSFTVSWWTLKPVGGFISFATSESLGTTAVDDRDQGAPGKYVTHHVTLKNLTPQSTYYFKIGSGSKLYDDKGKAYIQVSAPTTAKPPSVPEPVFGKVINADGKIPQEAIIYATVGPSSNLLSSYIKKDGNFLITLNNARNKDLSDYIIVLDSDLISLSVSTGDGQEFKKSIEATQRSSQIKFELKDNTTTSGSNQKTSNQQDINGDGIINSMDFALSAKEKVKR